MALRSGANFGEGYVENHQNSRRICQRFSLLDSVTTYPSPKNAVAFFDPPSRGG